jgi:hypothetical protein
MGATPVLQRQVGEAGTGSAVGEVAQFLAPRALHVCPWAASNVLVVDSGNDRVVEVDVSTGLLVKVRVNWLERDACVLRGAPSRFTSASYVDSLSRSRVYMCVAPTPLPHVSIRCGSRT